MDNMREEFETLIELINVKNYKAVDEVLKDYLKDISNYIMFLAGNGIIAIDELNTLSEHMTTAIKNKDYFLLKDVLQYGLLNVYDQLFPREESVKEEE